jgi:hypothetical protein
MTDYQVGDTRRPTLTINVYDGNTVPVLTVVSPSGVVTVPAITGGAGTWTATASYTLTGPGDWTERWVVTNAVSGLGAGSTSVTITVDPLPPAPGADQSPAFATAQQYADIIGGPIPTNLARLLRVATSVIRQEIGGAIYDSADAATVATLIEATCEQVAWACGNGWTNGYPVATRALSIGSASLGATINPGAGGSGATPTLSPIARELLLNAGLLGGAPDAFGYGLVYG